MGLSDLDSESESLASFKDFLEPCAKKIEQKGKSCISKAPHRNYIHI